jgi:hypothetical protein
MENTDEKKSNVLFLKVLFLSLSISVVIDKQNNSVRVSMWQVKNKTSPSLEKRRKREREREDGKQAHMENKTVMKAKRKTKRELVVFASPSVRMTLFSL